MSFVYNPYMDVSFGEREKKMHKDPAGNWTQDLPITSVMLLSLSHWTHGRGVEASLLITAMLAASADSSCLSLSHTTLVWMEIPSRWGCGPGVEWLFMHIAWVDTLTIFLKESHHINVVLLLKYILRNLSSYTPVGGVPISWNFHLRN